MLSTNPINRRRAERVTRHLEILYSHQGRPRSGRLLSVSRSGARILVRDPVAESLTIQLQLHSGDVPGLQLQVETVWTERLRGGSEIRGVRFGRTPPHELEQALAPIPVRLVALPPASF